MRACQKQHKKTMLSKRSNGLFYSQYYINNYIDGMRHVYYICFVFKLQAYFLFQTHLSCLKELLLKNMLRKTTKQ